MLSKFKKFYAQNATVDVTIRNFLLLLFIMKNSDDQRKIPYSLSFFYTIKQVKLQLIKLERSGGAEGGATSSRLAGFMNLFQLGGGPMTGIRWPWLEEEEEEHALLGRLREGGSIKILPSFLRKSTSVRAILV
jgi:hypothetical protein